jgi:hypothetical protein
MILTGRIMTGFMGLKAAAEAMRRVRVVRNNMFEFSKVSVVLRNKVFRFYEKARNGRRLMAMFFRFLLSSLDSLLVSPDEKPHAKHQEQTSNPGLDSFIARDEIQNFMN